MSLRVPSNFNTPRAYHRLDPTPSYPRSDTQGSLMGALNTPREAEFLAEPICFDNLKAASLAGSSDQRPPSSRCAQCAHEEGPLKTLSRCLHSHRHALLVWSISQWRLSLSHVLRHQALTRLQAQSQAQQQSLAALRRSLPSAAPPRRATRPAAVGATPAQQQAAQQELAPQGRPSRSAGQKLQAALPVQRAGPVAVRGVRDLDQTPPPSPPASTASHGPGGISATAPRA